MALTVQVPERSKVKVVPEIVHCEVVAEVKETVRLEVDVALKATVPVPSVLLARAEKEIVWLALATVTMLVVEAVL